MGKDNINNYVKIIGNVFADLNIWNGISARTVFGIVMVTLIVEQ